MHPLINKKVLVTTSNWFYGADGKTYRAIHGILKNVQEVSKLLGFTPNRSHANWYLEIGEMVIMGCQVMYLIQCDNVEQNSVISDWKDTENGISVYNRPNLIYFVS